MILCCFYGDVVFLLLRESAASEVKIAHVSHEFLTLRLQTSAKGFSESFCNPSSGKMILIFRYRIAFAMYVLL